MQWILSSPQSSDGSHIGALYCQLQQISIFSLGNQHFPGAILHYLCIFNRKFKTQLVFMLQFAVSHMYSVRNCPKVTTEMGRPLVLKVCCELPHLRALR